MSLLSFRNWLHVRFFSNIWIHSLKLKYSILNDLIFLSIVNPSKILVIPHILISQIFIYPLVQLKVAQIDLFDLLQTFDLLPQISHIINILQPIMSQPPPAHPHVHNRLHRQHVALQLDFEADGKTSFLDEIASSYLRVILNNCILIVCLFFYIISIKFLILSSFAYL